MHARAWVGCAVLVSVLGLSHNVVAQRVKPSPTPVSWVYVDSSSTPKVLGVGAMPGVTLIKGANGDVGMLDVPRLGFPQNVGTLFYPSLDCTGTAYVNVPVDTIIANAPVREGVAYVPGDSRATIESSQVASFWSTPGRCEVLGFGQVIPSTPVAAASPFDLRSFVPPFRVQLK